MPFLPFPIRGVAVAAGFSAQVSEVAPLRSSSERSVSQMTSGEVQAECRDSRKVRNVLTGE